VSTETSRATIPMIWPRPAPAPLPNEIAAPVATGAVSMGGLAAASPEPEWTEKATDPAVPRLSEPAAGAGAVPPRPASAFTDSKPPRKLTEVAGWAPAAGVSGTRMAVWASKSKLKRFATFFRARDTLTITRPWA
jgi:hypothetical protein